MAKTRMVNTRFWNDGFISQLDPIEKLLFIYFITNEHTNICGVYELPLKVAAVETGIDPSMFEKIFPRLKEKILYIEGWVCIKNFPKHQNAENPKVKIGIKNELRQIPSHIIKKAIAYGYPMVDSSHLDSDSDLDSDLDLYAVDSKLSPASSLEEQGPKTFEDYMQREGYSQDGMVDDVGGEHKWWKDASGTKVSKSGVTRLLGAYRASQRVSRVETPTEISLTDKFVEIYQQAMMKKFGSSPQVNNKSKLVLRKGLIEKYPKAFIQEYAEWFIANPKVEKKWKYQVTSLASENFINQFLAQQP